MKTLLQIVGLVLAAIGILWILQGLNVLRGGMMGGQVMWAVIGAIAVIVGIVLLALASRRTRVIR